MFSPIGLEIVLDGLNFHRAQNFSVKTDKLRVIFKVIFKPAITDKMPLLLGYSENATVMELHRPV